MGISAIFIFLCKNTDTPTGTTALQVISSITVRALRPPVPLDVNLSVLIAGNRPDFKNVIDKFVVIKGSPWPFEIIIIDEVGLDRQIVLSRADSRRQMIGPVVNYVISKIDSFRLFKLRVPAPVMGQQVMMKTCGNMLTAAWTASKHCHRTHPIRIGLQILGGFG